MALSGLMSIVICMFVCFSGWKLLLLVKKDLRCQSYHYRKEQNLLMICFSIRGSNWQCVLSGFRRSARLVACFLSMA